ncbi:NADH-quinone oxidoreductase subunit L [Pendulispora brunnea]|uniref:NADH-quinone oxidoreductase subunit L n=1 Tax=Pendulispora brunnea TaxID=2905690 RepID=A0ABZ2KIM1_9BACT
MKLLESLFPSNDFSLIAVILGMPLLGAFINGIWGRRLGKPAVKMMTLTAVGVSFIASLIAFLLLDHAAHGGEHSHTRLYFTAWEWMHTNGGRAGSVVNIDLKFSIDALNGVMMLIVTGVGFLIHLYATSYMENDPGYHRFFAYLNLFIFSMLVLILGDNLPVLFVGWEGVGLCSYLLIGFWYEHMPNAAAGKKAFIANRIGDFGLICAMFLLVHYTGALDWTGIQNNASILADNPADAYQIHLWPLGGGQYQGFFKFLQPTAPITISAATAVGLALLLGCAGKSAQIPLYVWLPDAMAGPTPVSALIHAATMVTAGIYLVCRLSFVFVLSPFVMTTVLCVGAATALLAATIALVQNDIKKVLAYSTVSQLGFMFMGVGAGAFTAGFFHVLTHAFFKACLFLGAGSVIHAMHARIHDDVKSQDMRYMGGLKKYMPYTYWTFFVSTLAIAGCPLLSGFFSKDEILYRAYVNHSISPVAAKMAARHIAIWQQPEWIGKAVYAVGIITAAMTAFYMFRCFFLTFHGSFRGWAIGRGSGLTPAHGVKVLPKDEEHDAHGHDAHDDHDDDHGHHHEEDLTVPGPAPHESPLPMTVPLLILAAFAAFAGLLNPAPLTKHLPLEHWLEPVFEEATKAGVKVAETAEHLEYPLMVPGVLAFLIGLGLAYAVYVKAEGKPAQRWAEAVPRLHRAAYNKWYVDEFYEATILSAVDALAETAAAFDQWFVDGILAKLSSLVVAALGTVLRTFQTGVVHVYAAAMVVGIAVISWFFVAPHAQVSTTPSPNGDYVVTAAPGMGYSYRWDADGNGEPDKPEFTDQTSVKVHLDPGKELKVKLEVTNAFGRHATVEVPLNRPAAQNPMELGSN